MTMEQSAAAKDLYYDLVKNALRKEGWRITHDPLRLQWPTGQSAPDHAEAGAGELLFAAEKDERKISVVTKSFIGLTDLQDLAGTFAQLTVYRRAVHRMDPDRTLYLAIRQATYEAFIAGQVRTLFPMSWALLLLVFEPRTEAILRWVPGL
jgi:hypothetical protein